MGQQNVSSRTRPGRRACAVLSATLVAAAAVAVGLSGTAEAAPAPTAQLSFSPATVSAGTDPQMTYLSQNVPSGALLYLQESADGGGQWKTIDKTTATQATANLAPQPAGDDEFRIVITDNGTVLATSSAASLTVTSAGGATPTPPATPHPPTPTATPSSSGVPWMTTVVKEVWKTAVEMILAWIISLF